MDMDTLKSILKVDKDVWEKEAAEIEEHYKKFGDKLPKAKRRRNVNPLRRFFRFYNNCRCLLPLQNLIPCHSERVA